MSRRVSVWMRVCACGISQRPAYCDFCDNNWEQQKWPRNGLGYAYIQPDYKPAYPSPPHTPHLLPFAFPLAHPSFFWLFPPQPTRSAIREAHRSKVTMGSEWVSPVNNIAMRQSYNKNVAAIPVTSFSHHKNCFWYFVLFHLRSMNVLWSDTKGPVAIWWPKCV